MSWSVERPHGQRGIALVVVLLLLLSVTLIGLAAMRGTLMQERMAGNVAARGVAFQATEAALREAEGVAAELVGEPAGAACDQGVCPQPAPLDTPRWETAGFWDTASNYRTPTIQGYVDGSSVRYMIEYMGRGRSSTCTTAVDPSGPPCTDTVRNYRITARSQLDNGAEVILQSMYQVE